MLVDEVMLVSEWGRTGLAAGLAIHLREDWCSLVQKRGQTRLQKASIGVLLPILLGLPVTEIQMCLSDGPIAIKRYTGVCITRCPAEGCIVSKVSRAGWLCGIIKDNHSHEEVHGKSPFFFCRTARFIV